MSKGTHVLLVDIYRTDTITLGNWALSSEVEDAFLYELATPYDGVYPRGTLVHVYQKTAQECS